MPDGKKEREEAHRTHNSADIGLDRSSVLLNSESSGTCSHSACSAKDHKEDKIRKAGREDFSGIDKAGELIPTKSENSSMISEGYRFGEFTVVGATHRRKSGYTIWKCQCSCGRIIEMDTRWIQRKTMTDCGCKSLPEAMPEQMKGRVFGSLRALYPIHPEKQGAADTMWLCCCECGTEIEVKAKDLLSGRKNSCGCRPKNSFKLHPGQRFGSLTVVEFACKKKKNLYWRCRCDCGNETIVSESSLLRGKTKSCGCLRRKVVRQNLCIVHGTSVRQLELSRNGLRSHNTSGHNGVYFNKKNRKWIAQITFQNRNYYLGSFMELDEAVKARRKGESMHDDFLDWYYSRPSNNAEGTSSDHYETKANAVASDPAVLESPEVPCLHSPASPNRYADSAQKSPTGSNRIVTPLTSKETDLEDQPFEYLEIPIQHFNAEKDRTLLSCRLGHTYA